MTIIWFMHGVVIGALLMSWIVVLALAWQGYFDEAAAA